jgi:hypothetical protein
MKKRRDSSPITDIEKLHPTVAEFSGDELGGEPLTVRPGDLWSDFVRVADKTNDPEDREKRGSAVPLLDDMKGILQWD